eukprot:scaffold3598_cov57-Phaeocystis_antarctica.AAC.4
MRPRHWPQSTACASTIQTAILTMMKLRATTTIPMTVRATVTIPMTVETTRLVVIPACCAGKKDSVRATC